MDQNQSQHERALRAAQMYYYQNLPMKKIGAELGISHSTVSRLLNWARANGLVEIRINDLRSRSSPLEELIKLHHKIRDVQVVPIPDTASEEVRQERVTRAAANYLTQLMAPNMILGVAWGHTVNQIASHLTPKALVNSHVVQLNGGETITSLGNFYTGELISQFANNFEAKAHLLTAPALFKHPETKTAMWKEPSIRRILDLQANADILLFSVGNFDTNISSAVYRNEQLSDRDLADMKQQQIVGDIANMMLRADGSFEEVAMNQRACGPDLSLFRQVDRAICVITSPEKLQGLNAALMGGYVTDLILDESTARSLVQVFPAL